MRELVLIDRHPPHSGRRIARNTTINLIGFALPLFAALFAIPTILSELGPDRFGLLALAWAAVGYMGMFDLGFSQSLTRNLAQALGNRDNENVASLIGSGLLVLVILSAVGAIVTFTLLPYAVDAFVTIPSGLRQDANHSFMLLALIVPTAIISGGLTGILEARHRFDLSNAVSVPLGVFNFLAPLFALQFSKTLFAVIVALSITRIIAMVALGILVSRVALSVRAMTYSWEDMVRLAKFGGWVTVSRIIVPLTGYFDRFAIATLVSLKALSVYAPPVEIATRFLMVPSAMAKVLLPAISSRSLDNDLTAARLLNKGIKFSLLAMFPLALLVVLFAEEGLRWWLSSELATGGTRVLQLMMISVFINSLGYPAAMFLLGIYRPDYSAKIQLIGMPLYILAVMWNVMPNFRNCRRRREHGPCVRR